MKRTDICNYQQSYYSDQKFLSNFEEILKEMTAPQSLLLGNNLLMIRKRISIHITEISKGNNQKPLVITLLTSPSRKLAVKDFSLKLAKSFSSNVYLIREIPNEKDKFHDEINNHTFFPPGNVIILPDLEVVPAQIATVLMKFCDNFNAPCNSAAFIFILTSSKIDQSDYSTLKYRETDNLSHETLKNSWSSELPSRILDPLLSRILDLVVLV